MPNPDLSLAQRANELRRHGWRDTGSDELEDPVSKLRYDTTTGYKVLAQRLGHNPGTEVPKPIVAAQVALVEELNQLEHYLAEQVRKIKASTPEMIYSLNLDNFMSHVGRVVVAANTTSRVVASHKS